jgi:hypothetical protein
MQTIMVLTAQLLGKKAAVVVQVRVLRELCDMQCGVM